MKSANRCRTRGFTLIEMVVALVVIGVALSGVMLAFRSIARNSANPVIDQQLIAIAQAASEEVMLQPYVPKTNTTTASGCSRAAFNDVDDFNGYATTGNICTPDGVTVPGLAGYSMSISVAPAAAVSGVSMKQISVTASKGTDSFVVRALRADLS